MSTSFPNGITANVTGALTGNVTGNVTGALTGNVTGNVTGVVTGYAFKTEARTATTTGATTGTISAGSTFVTVTCDSAAKIIILPAPVVGLEITILNGATGYELRSSAPATISINGGSDTNAESAVAASMTTKLICVSATAWVGFSVAADGTLTALEAAA